MSAAGTKTAHSAPRMHDSRTDAGSFPVKLRSSPCAVSQPGHPVERRRDPGLHRSVACPTGKGVFWSGATGGRVLRTAATVARHEAILSLRVQKIAEPPPSPTSDEIAEKQAEEEKAAFEAVSADSPISAWFPYTRYGVREDLGAIAIAKVTAKPTFLVEMQQLMLSEDRVSPKKRSGSSNSCRTHSPELTRSRRRHGSRHCGSHPQGERDDGRAGFRATKRGAMSRFRFSDG